MNLLLELSTPSMSIPESRTPEPPLAVRIKASVTSRFVVLRAVVLPLTVKSPLRTKSAALRFPLKEAELPSEAIEPAWVSKEDMLD